MAMPHSAESKSSLRVLTSVGPPTVSTPGLNASMAGRRRTLSLVLTNRTRSTLATLIAAFALIAAACGGDSSTSTESSAPAADPGGSSDSSDSGSSADEGGSTDDGAASVPAESDEPDAVTVEADSADPANASWPHQFIEDGVGGGIIDANDYEGQDLVLWFWAPW